MPTTPYARILVSIDGAASTSGGVTCDPEAEIQVSYESTIGWPATPVPYLEIYAYPDGYDPGAGWTLESVVQPAAVGGTGDAWRYYGATPPPAFDAPTAAEWGKLGLMLVVGGGRKNGTISGDMIDIATVISVLGPNGEHDIMHREAKQFGGWKKWVAAYQFNMHLLGGIIADLVASGGGATVTLTAGAGLTGGGDTSANRTFAVAAADASITVNADSIEASGAFVAKNISTTGTLTAGAAGVTNSLTGLLVEKYDAIGATDIVGILLKNSTALVSTGEQRPPLLGWEGHGWNTSAGGSDELDEIVFQPTLTAAAGGPKIELRPRYRRNSGAYGGLGLYWTTQDPGLFGLAAVVDTLIIDASGNGVRFVGDGNGGIKKNSTHVMLTSGGSNNVQIATNGTVRWDLFSTGAIEQSFDAAAMWRWQWGTAGVNYTDRAKRAVTTTSSTPENIITFAMPDNCAASFEVKVYCYVIANPAVRAYFHWHGYVNRNGGAPTLDQSGAIAADKTVGGWGGPPLIAIAVGAPTTNDVSLQLTAPGTDPLRWVVTKYELNVCTTAA